MTLSPGAQARLEGKPFMIDNEPLNGPVCKPPRARISGSRLPLGKLPLKSHLIKVNQIRSCHLTQAEVYMQRPPLRTQDPTNPSSNRSLYQTPLIDRPHHLPLQYLLNLRPSLHRHPKIA